MRTTWPCITEAEINRCFLEVVSTYLKQVPPSQAATVRQCVDILLSSWNQLSSQEQIRLMNLLWEHEGSLLDTGYQLKEDLVRWLRCRDDRERRAMAETLCCTWERQAAPAFRPLLQTLRQYARNSHASHHPAFTFVPAIP